jgi:hypothetical protein
MSTTAPRFTRTSPRGFQHELVSPLPSTLAGIAEIRERVEQHERVAARLAELRARRVELARQLAEQEAADKQAATQAALEGKTPAKRQKAARLRGLLEETESEVAGFENALARSADSLLTAAVPHVAEATENAVEGKEAAIGRARELLGALDAALEEAGNLTAERIWLDRLDGRGRIEPFRPGGRDPGLGQLRRRIHDAFAEWQAKEEQHRAEAERQRRWREEHEAEWARQKAAAERESAERRVRYEGLRLTHRGGRPVGPAGDFQDEEPRP